MIFYLLISVSITLIQLRIVLCLHISQYLRETLTTGNGIILSCVGSLLLHLSLLQQPASKLIPRLPLLVNIAHVYIKVQEYINETPGKMPPKRLYCLFHYIIALQLYMSQHINISILLEFTRFLCN